VSAHRTAMNGGCPVRRT